MAVIRDNANVRRNLKLNNNYISNDGDNEGISITDAGAVAISGTIELGHATDTTLARSGSGDVTIEGNTIYRAGGTDVAIADGGTGASNSNAWLNSRITTNANGSLNYDATGATAVNHDSLTGFVANEHIDWTASSAGTIHSSNYTVGSSQAITALTGGDLTIYEDANNADVSLKMGTSASEALSIEVLNGASNKTAEEIKISTATDSGATDAGKISIHIDGIGILDIDDGGIDMAAGKTVAINGTDITGGGASSLSDLSDWSSSNDSVSSGNYATLMPNIGDFHHDENTGALWLRYGATHTKKFYMHQDYNHAPPAANPECSSLSFVTTQGGSTSFSSSYLIGTDFDTSSGDSPSIFVRAQYNSDVSSGPTGTPQVVIKRYTSSGSEDAEIETENLGSTSGQYEWTDGDDIDTGSSWDVGDYIYAIFSPNGSSEGGVALNATPSVTGFKVKGLVLMGICAANSAAGVKTGMDNAYGTFNKGNSSDGNYISSNNFTINDSTTGGWRFPDGSGTTFSNMKGSINQYDLDITMTTTNPYFFIAYNHSTQLTAITMNSFQVLGSFNTATTTWTNPAGKSATYRYYVFSNAQDNGVTYDMTGVE